METPKSPLTTVEQAAMQALVDHLEPCDCRWDTYADAARAVARAVEKAQCDEHLNPPPEPNFWDDRTTPHLNG